MRRLEDEVKQLHIKIEQTVYKKLLKKAGDVPISGYIRRLIKNDLNDSI